MASKVEKKIARRLAREEMLKQIRRDTLLREKALDEASVKKIKSSWFEALVDTKIPQMQDNLKHILHYMEKLIEAESYRKSLFEDERRELEEKSLLMAQSHASALESLFDIYEKRISDLHAAFRRMVNEKKEEAKQELDKIEENETITQENMQTMLYQMNQNTEQKEEAMNCDMFLKLDDERSKHTELKENLRNKLEQSMEKRWGEITATLNKYEETTKARRKDYIALKAKDDADSKTIRQQMKKTQKMFEQLEELKNCLDECYAPKETIELIKDTREERTKFFNTFKQLKVMVDGELQEDETNLKVLSVTSNSITDELKKLCRKGEQILTTYRICLGLETEMEKVAPVGGSTGFRKEALHSPPKAKDEEEQEWEVMTNFWKKIANAQLSKFALIKCIEKMKKENQACRKLLASQLREISSNGELPRVQIRELQCLSSAEQEREENETNSKTKLFFNFK